MIKHMYAKTQQQKKFKALDLETYQQVDNLMYATMIDENNIIQARKVMEELQELNPTMEFKIA